MPDERPVPSAAGIATTSAVHMMTASLDDDSLNTSPSTTNNSRQNKKVRKKSSVKSFIPPAAAPPSRASIQMFPNIFEKQDPSIEYGALRDGSVPSVCSSSDSMDQAWSPPANHKEDLYSWMAKQQSESTKQREKQKTTVSYSFFAERRWTCMNLKEMLIIMLYTIKP